MKDYMAPMEGVTNFIYRNVYHEFYYPMDKYFTPFISAKPNKRLSRKEICEVSEETNPGLYVVPQIMTNCAEDFIQTARILKEEYGHNEINLNLGCPSGTVTAKKKGAGFLGEPQLLERFLDTIYTKLDMDISIKTRVGVTGEEEWEYLLDIYRKFPIYELIIHPRLQKDLYKGRIRLDAYNQACDSLSVSLGYNGDIHSREAYDRIISSIKRADSVMYGRGVVSAPWLLGSIRGDSRPDKKVFREFHNRLYEEYRKYVSGDRNVLFRMKEMWSYMITSFTDCKKYAKKIKKAQSLGEYEAAVSSLFAEQELIEDDKY
ncbi:MAG: tRNA-dihydrouridine synthase family protein [Blautia sp.]|nr:tRNA-dihydrouridine synthase family protein [Blautia sp.]